MLRVSLALLSLIWISACAPKTELPAQKVIEEEPTRIYLVRHAEKLKVNNKDPKLAFKGELRAKALADVLKDEGIDAIYSTPYQRTQMTVAPLAKLKQIDVQHYSLPAALLAKKIMSLHRGQTIVVVGHSNTVPKLINALGVEAAIQIKEDQYGDLFVVERENNKIKFTVGRYGQ